MRSCSGQCCQWMLVTQLPKASPRGRTLDSSDRVNIFASVEKQQAIISECLVSEGAKELFEASLYVVLMLSGMQVRASKNCDDLAGPSGRSSLAGSFPAIRPSLLQRKAPLNLVALGTRKTPDLTLHLDSTNNWKRAFCLPGTSKLLFCAASQTLRLHKRI
jgi:hypothetical protein